MYWPDNSTSAGAAPAVPAVSSASPSYFTSGVPSVTPPTVVDDWWLNTVLAELVAIATIDGASLDKANNDQAAEVLQPIRGIKAATSDSTATGTTFKALIAASTSSRANNASGAFVAACTFGTATGAGSAVIAATGTIASSALASGANSAVIGSYGTSAVNKIDAAGDRSAVIASKATSGGVITHADSEASAVVACVEGTSGLSVNGIATGAFASKGGLVQTSTATACAIIASQDCAAGDTGVTGAACIASGGSSAADGDFSATLASSAGCYASGDRSLVAASMNSDASGAQSAVIGSYDAQASVTHSMVLASGETGVTIGCRQARSILAASRRSEVGVGSGSGQAMLVCSDRAELIDSNTLALGYHATTTPTFNGTSNKNLMIKFDGVNGDGYFDGGADLGVADYAELFELAVPGSPMAPGVLVALDEFGKAKVAEAGDEVIGVSTLAPSILGNAAPLNWSGRYLVDDWGVALRQDVIETREDGSTYTVSARVENPDYDPFRGYTPRKERRDQYVAVGLLGQLRVRVQDGVQPGAVVAPGLAGVATASRAKGRGVRIMQIFSSFDEARGYAIALAFVG